MQCHALFFFFGKSSLFLTEIHDQTVYNSKILQQKCLLLEVFRKPIQIWERKRPLAMAVNTFFNWMNNFFESFLIQKMILQISLLY